MLLINAKLYLNGLLRKGSLLIDDGIIQSIKLESNEGDLSDFLKTNEDNIVIDCKDKVIIPGIIDIHSHLRDMGQSDKETFLTGTQAAAFSGITTVFNMPNTDPPAITAEQVEKWMRTAQENIHVNVGFISGVPKDMNFKEITDILDLGVIGFKIYPLSSLNGINWNDPLNVQKLLDISSKFQIPIFIHADKHIHEEKKEELLEEYMLEKYPILELHDKLFPMHKEAEYVNFILDNYYKLILDNNLKENEYPIIHFCHISGRDSYSLIKKALQIHSKLNISFEITPHHLLLSNKISLINPNHGKVLPPLRAEEHSSFLYNELKSGRIQLLGTDHAPHTLAEKTKEYSNSPSGFPGFETYPLLLLDKVCRYELSLETFVKTTSENPAQKFNLKKKGFIKEGYDADIIIIDRIAEYPIKSSEFKTMAKYSPFTNYMTTIQIWKVFLKGKEINIENPKPLGKILLR